MPLPPLQQPCLANLRRFFLPPPPSLFLCPSHIPPTRCTTRRPTRPLAPSTSTAFFRGSSPGGASLAARLADLLAASPPVSPPMALAKAADPPNTTAVAANAHIVHVQQHLAQHQRTAKAYKWLSLCCWGPRVFHVGHNIGMNQHGAHLCWTRHEGSPQSEPTAFWDLTPQIKSCIDPSVRRLTLLSGP
jgi:hypothetical protein